jgi:hypothetical protein
LQVLQVKVQDSITPKHILSFGGGVNSGALLVLLLEEGLPLDEVLFADTGGELPETYAFIDTVRNYLLQFGIPFRTVMNRIHGRDLYSTCMERRVIPSTIWRWSTRDFKVRPIYRYYRSLSRPVVQYLAIAYDEIERMKDSKVKSVNSVFPLVERKITRKACVEILERAGLPVPIKSSCFFCPFATLDRWKYIRDRHPELYERAITLEENSKHFPSQRLTDQVFRERAKITLRELPGYFDNPRGFTIVEEMAPCGAECGT